MKKYPQIQSVRIEIEPDKVSMGYEWIRQASQEGYHIIATYHKYTVLGSDDANVVVEAAQWWQANYNYLSKAGSFDVNLINEWGSHNQTPDSYAKAYNSAISIVRSVYSGPLILDIPGWGQETRTAAQASPQLADNKLIFSAHVYPNSYNQGAGRWVSPDDMSELHASGRPCIVGEFGDIYGSGGQCDVRSVVQAAKQVGFDAVYGWAWNGDGEELNMVAPAWHDNAQSSSYTEANYFWQIMDLL